MMARSKTAPFKGRIKKRKTERLNSSHLACNTRPVQSEWNNVAVLTACFWMVGEVYPIWR